MPATQVFCSCKITKPDLNLKSKVLIADYEKLKQYSTYTNTCSLTRIKKWDCMGGFFVFFNSILKCMNTCTYFISQHMYIFISHLMKMFYQPSHVHILSAFECPHGFRNYNLLLLSCFNLPETWLNLSFVTGCVSFRRTGQECQPEFLWHHPSRHIGEGESDWLLWSEQSSVVA